ncbi:pyridine nucleotide-disulfide oxidoreductase family protein [Staphylococcus aureus]|nr:pyridine nucleotide-disulfide oxidoreductase family protein [Staphylococcus aureus]
MHWTIIGGGIQGTAIAQKLLSSGLTTDLLTIIDPHETFCQRFNSYTNRIEMPYLRSPIVHHVHPQPFHLKQFAKQHQYTNAFYGPYQRPELTMFMNHIAHASKQYQLEDCLVQGLVQTLDKQEDKWHIKLEDGQIITTDCVVIAIGSTNIPFMPDILKDKQNVNHIFEKEHDQVVYDKTDHIVGSGITAAHLALKLLNHDNDKKIHLWLNKDIEIHDFDADTGWLGPKNMSSFLSTKSMPERNAIVQRERHKGSMPHELYLRLKKHIKNGRINVHKTPITQISGGVINTENDSVPYQQIMVATGFEQDFMSQPLIKQLIQNYDAPINECNYPVISEKLEWIPNLFVAGCFADLELGPFGRNVMGGRKAAERIEQAFLKLQQYSA